MHTPNYFIDRQPTASRGLLLMSYVEVVEKLQMPKSPPHKSISYEAIFLENRVFIEPRYASSLPFGIESNEQESSASVKKEIAGLYSGRRQAYDCSEWHDRIAHKLVDYLSITAGSQVLDIAAGTGMVALYAASKVGPHGSVIGIDSRASERHPEERVTDTNAEKPGRDDSNDHGIYLYLWMGQTIIDGVSGLFRPRQII